MNEQKRKHQAILIAAVLGPSALVLAIRILSGVGPSSAQADVSEAVAGTYSLRADAPGAEEAELIAWLKSEQTLGMHESPMFAEPNDEEAPSPTRGREAGQRELPVLSSIVGGERRAAMLDGRPRRVGDRIDGFWTVDTIDVRWVELSTPGGAVVRIDLDRASELRSEALRRD